MLMVGQLTVSLGWQLPETLWSKVTPLLKLAHRYLTGLSLGQVPPVWILALDVARSLPLI